MGILAIIDTQNKAVPAGLEPVAVGLLILAIGLSLGVNCGFPLNPARDLGPRRLPWAKLPIYCLVQLLSAFCASGATYAVYYGNVAGGICVWLGVPCRGFA